LLLYRFELSVNRRAAWFWAAAAAYCVNMIYCDCPDCPPAPTEELARVACEPTFPLWLFVGANSDCWCYCLTSWPGTFYTRLFSTFICGDGPTTYTP
jgi:hypothetical protein